jgi:hypothetical protein
LITFKVKPRRQTPLFEAHYGFASAKQNQIAQAVTFFETPYEHFCPFTLQAESIAPDGQPGCVFGRVYDHPLASPSHRARARTGATTCTCRGSAAARGCTDLCIERHHTA